MALEPLSSVGILDKNKMPTWARKPTRSLSRFPLPFLKERIKQLFEQYGLRFVETEESYSSQASFVDGDSVPTYGEKPDDWGPSGKRIKRGVYRTAAGYVVNADANGAANIIKKVAGRLGINLDQLGRGVLTSPEHESAFGLLVNPRALVTRE